MDNMALQASPFLEMGKTYQTHALLINPSISDLREAGQECPAWVFDRYLLLPQDFSPKIQALAFKLTNGLDNPYDQAAVITQYPPRRSPPRL